MLALFGEERREHFVRLFDQRDADWFAALDQTVTAAEARFELGEGTLFELLDHRRARLQALDDYALWLSEWWNARAQALRLRGGTPDASLLCTDPFREND